MSDEISFEGHEPRRCGEHRTVGSHRAWCYEDSEWCYPSSPCAGCGPTREELEEQVGRYRLAWMSARRRALKPDHDQRHPYGGIADCPLCSGPFHDRSPGAGWWWAGS